MSIAVYPGSFDPITKGHLDVIERSSHIFDTLVVVIMENSKKKTSFSQEERYRMIQKCCSHLNNVRIEIGSGLTVDYAQAIGANVLIRGIRAISDYEYELSQASANQMLNPGIETLFMIARPQYSFISSSMAKEIARYGGDVSGCIPCAIYDQFIEKFNER